MCPGCSTRGWGRVGLFQQQAIESEHQSRLGSLVQYKRVNAADQGGVCKVESLRGPSPSGRVVVFAPALASRRILEEPSVPQVIGSHL